LRAAGANVTTGTPSGTHLVGGHPCTTASIHDRSCPWTNLVNGGILLVLFGREAPTKRGLPPVTACPVPGNTTTSVAVICGCTVVRRPFADKRNGLMFGRSWMFFTAVTGVSCHVDLTVFAAATGTVSVSRKTRRFANGNTRWF